MSFVFYKELSKKKVSIKTLNKIKALLVGYGEMAMSRLQILENFSLVTVLGVVRREKVKLLPELTVFSSLQDSLSRLKPDLVIIATPHESHFKLAKLCLEYDCHVLVEKPLTLHFSESEALVQLAEERNKLLVVGLQRRYEGFATIFRQTLREGKLGDIKLVHGLFAHRFSNEEPQGWRSDPQQVGAGIVDDSALHLVDLLIYFSGARVQNLQARVLSENDHLPHSFTCFFETENGVTVSACGSYLSPVKTVQEEVSIWGTSGALFARRFCKEWNTEPPMVFYKSTNGNSQEEFDLSKFPSGKNLPLEILLKVITGKLPRTDLLTEAKHILETHRVIELIRKSFK